MLAELALLGPLVWSAWDKHCSQPLSLFTGGAAPRFPSAQEMTSPDMRGQRPTFRSPVVDLLLGHRISPHGAKVGWQSSKHGEADEKGLPGRDWSSFSSSQGQGCLCCVTFGMSSCVR